MNKLFYPAIFHVAEEGGFWITFPDIPECMTQGEDMQQGYEMARQREKMELPTPSVPSAVHTAANEYCVVIEFDMLAYKKRTNSRSVKKTLTLPEWLNEEALSMGINFSQALQEILIQKVNAKS